MGLAPSDPREGDFPALIGGRIRISDQLLTWTLRYVISGTTTACVTDVARIGFSYNDIQ